MSGDYGEFARYTLSQDRGGVTTNMTPGQRRMNRERQDRRYEAWKEAGKSKAPSLASSGGNPNQPSLASRLR